MSSTYKPVFLRSLLDLGDLHDPQKAEDLVGREWIERKSGKIRLDLNFIAVRFAKYYWDMEYSFRLRQSQDPHDANITRLIKGIHDPDKKPPTIKELAADEMEDFRNMVITKSIKPEVLVHLRTDMNDLYQRNESKIIELDEDIVEFLHTHKILLRKGLTGVLAKYLEKLNRMTPQISNKIDSEGARRAPLKSEIQLRMRKWQDSKCFYCKNDLLRPHVDHVIPYNYIFTTDVYNCALACPHCNCTKSDMLPEREFFDGVLERNQGIMDYFDSINLDYNENSYQRLFEACVEEYNGKEFFRPAF